MTVRITPPSDRTVNSSTLIGGIQKTLESTGRLPPVSLGIQPIEPANKPKRTPFFLDRFLNYQFQSSILIPVDTFSFNFAAPDEVPFYERVKDGDIVTLFGNDRPLATGFIDSIDIETDEQFGEKVSISGRDLLGQLEDQDAISKDGKPLWGNATTFKAAAEELIIDTRIRSPVKFQNLKNVSGQFFATSPSETKLAALQRLIEPGNALAWADPSGSLILGRPNMGQPPKGVFKVLRGSRDSNCMSMKAVYAAASIPNIVCAIWSGQETTQERLSVNQIVNNMAKGPTRLREAGNRIPKSVVVSIPTGNDPSALTDLNVFLASGGGANIQNYALREIAKHNQKELVVQVVVPGHYDEQGEPYKIDTVYRILYDRGSIDKLMYCFQVDYTGGLDSGQKTTLWFCNLGSIVAGTITK